MEKFSFPNGCSDVVSIIQEMINHVYPSIKQHFPDSKWLCQRNKYQTVDNIKWIYLKDIPKQS